MLTHTRARERKPNTPLKPRDDGASQQIYNFLDI